MHLESGRYRSIFSVDRGYIRYETVRHGTFTNDRVARILSRILSSLPSSPHTRYLRVYVYVSLHLCMNARQESSLQVPCTSTGAYLSVRNHRRRRRTVYLLIVVALTMTFSLPPFPLSLYRTTMNRARLSTTTAIEGGSSGFLVT